MEESTPQQASSRYRKIIEGYKVQLRNHPDLKFSEYCRHADRDILHKIHDVATGKRNRVLE